MKANQRKMATNEWYFTLNGVFLEDFSALSTCILSGDEVNDLERDPWAGWRDWVGNNKDQLLWVDQSLLVPHWGKADHAPGWEALPRVWSSIPWRRVCWELEATAGGSIGANRVQPASKTRPTLRLSHQGESWEYSWIYLLGLISNTFMCLNSFIGTSSQPTSKTRALPTQAFWSEGKSYQCSQSRLLGALRQTFIKDIEIALLVFGAMVAGGVFFGLIEGLWLAALSR